ncbi:MAG: hypothetical protein P4L87_25685 [Formivibrio sp.]|nr:hypothetical protein [Formivibrio sp.]
MEHFEGSMDDTKIDQPLQAVCPKCGSHHCQLQSTARKAGIVVGGVFGAIIAAGLTGSKAGAVSGAAISSELDRRSPVTITGTIGGAIFGFARGAITGHAVGTEIDKSILRLYKCTECGLEF